MKNWNASGTKSVNHTTEEKFQGNHLTYVQLLYNIKYWIIIHIFIVTISWSLNFWSFSQCLTIFLLLIFNLSLDIYSLAGTPWHNCTHTYSSLFIRRWGQIGLEHLNGYHLSYYFFENWRKKSILKLFRIVITVRAWQPNWHQGNLFPCTPKSSRFVNSENEKSYD